ncbi:hypothetical protein CEXT_20391 [Caerostris extrusa]|uniref:Uncharacterized protein n=1 Tax=Caerostris extrusa TaxID=172846 RepID=A0AAV4RAJ8_CAEEX|nr:hypothetical protein CEXT_20391 [Caerostris extrusa]
MVHYSTSLAYLHENPELYFSSYYLVEKVSTLKFLANEVQTDQLFISVFCSEGFWSSLGILLDLAQFIMAVQFIPLNNAAPSPSLHSFLEASIYQAITS